MKFQFKILMFGRSGVGKTSLLAQLYNAIQTSPAFSFADFDSPSSHELDETHRQLLQFVRTTKAGVPRGVNSTTARREYRVSAAIPGFEHTLELVFVDMPGESLADPSRKQEWLDLLSSSDVVISVISSPALMEKNGQYNHEFNHPAQLKEYLSLALSSPACRGTKGIYLVPLKCEKYFNEPARILGRIRQAYGNHISLAQRHNHECGWVPVQTVGVIDFHSFALDEHGMPVDRYCLRDGVDEPECAPANHDVLAAAILRHAAQRLAYSFNATEAAAPVVDPLTEHCGAISFFNEVADKTFVRFEIPLPRPVQLTAPSGTRNSDSNRSSSCFAATTPVLMADGSERPISCVQVGQSVATWDPLLRRFCTGMVTRLGVHQNQSVISVSVSGTVLQVTGNHYFRVFRGWVRARDLEPGDQVVWAHRAGAGRVDWVDHSTERANVYNLYVRGTGTYVAGGAVVRSFVFAPLPRHILARIVGILTSAEENQKCQPV